jgi:hypothetical protein
MAKARATQYPVLHPLWSGDRVALALHFTLANSPLQTLLVSKMDYRSGFQMCLETPGIFNRNTGVDSISNLLNQN